MTYFNTTHEVGEGLRRRRVRAQTQEERILSWFQEHPREEVTPFEVRARVLPDAPITSVRRAITGLTDTGKLEKLPRKRQGEHGYLNYLWRLREEPRGQMELSLN